MAYQQDFTDKDKENQGAPAGEQVLTSSAPSTVGAPASPAQSSTPAPSKKGSGYTNLSQYVKANEDQAPEKIVNPVTSDLKTRLGDVQTKKRDFWTTTSNIAKANTIQDTGLNEALKANPGAQNEAAWKDVFLKQTGGYQGPKSIADIEGYQGLNQDVSKLDTDIQGLRDPSRLQARLQDTFGKNAPYTRGQNTLDSLIATTGKGAQALGQFQDEYAGQGVPQDWARIKDEGNQALKQALSVSEKTQKDTADALQAGKDAEIERARLAAEAEKAMAKKLSEKPYVAPPAAPPPEVGFKETPKFIPNRVFQEPINIAGDVPSEPSSTPFNIGGTAYEDPENWTPQRKQLEAEKAERLRRLLAVAANTNPYPGDR